MELKIKRFGDGELCRMIAVDKDFVFNNADLERITQICNEPEVYKFVTKDLLSGREYQFGDAEKFVFWAQKGWKINKWFVFLIRNNTGNIVACVDIKKIQETDHEFREIGFWASSESPGVMTNAVRKLEDFAKSIGIIGLYGLTLQENSKSQGVLDRADYLQSNQSKYTWDGIGRKHLRFEKKLK